ncbi:MAG TPA: hypothetical protein PKA28_18265 [Methylomusa anaerophila]|uniref:FlgN protein n=1 Tax=Methylomusa anaerophila TaxID=1930071 RepID=A0A348AH53_9FIRM|nr:hypothetical protein [Methylomusa anaerophila]BBB90401.1 hypothetical protein MAMMFC1_01052 [Methylomusa anaerophila]HML90384.1 hypothetical protein [Methylomusa anaerophila]
MVPVEEIQAGLAKKMAILEKISANIGTQRRFVQRREMKGLKRLLRDMDKLFDELAAVNQELRRNEQWKDMSCFRAAVGAIAAKQSEVLTSSAAMVQEAAMVRNHVAAQLRRLRAGRNITNRYVSCWLTRRPGGRFNQKG